MCMKRHLHFYSIGAVALFASVIFSIQLVGAYNSEEFSVYAETSSNSPGDTNVFLGSFTTPTPVADSIIHLGNGESAVVEPGDVLTAFASDELFIDMNSGESAGYNDGEAVILSADTALDATDTVLVEGQSVLSGMGDSEAVGAVGYLDHANNNTYNSGDDFVKLVYNGEGAALADDAAVTVFTGGDDDSETGYAFFMTPGTTSFDYANPPAIIGFENSEGRINNMSVVTSGSINFATIDIDDDLCLSDTNDDDQLDPMDGESIWFDVGGDCASFDTGVDIIINSQNNDLTGPHKMFGSVAAPDGFGPVSIGYIDADGDEVYDCARGELCEGIVVLAGSSSYPTGTTVSAGGMVLFIEGKIGNPTDGVSDVAFYGLNIDADGLGMVLMGVHDQGSDNEARYVYVDSNSSASFDDEDDVLETTLAMTGTNIADGVTFRYFPSNIKYLDSASGAYANDSYDSVEALVMSADSDLDIGSLAMGVGTDVLARSAAGILSTFDVDTVYYDADDSADYTAGEDIIEDIDGSLIYNGDQLQSLAVNNIVDDHPLGDDDFDHLAVYRRSGEACTGVTEDALVGEINAAPFLDTTITITDETFTGARAYCVYGDLAEDADAGEYFQLYIESEDMNFASALSPEDGDLAFSGVVSVVGELLAGVDANTFEASATAAYETTFTTAVTLDAVDRIEFEFPEGYTLTDTAAACTDDGESAGGTDSVVGDTVRFALADTIDAGSDVVCTISGVRNPTSAGEYAGFAVNTYRATEEGFILVEESTPFPEFTITQATSSSGGRRSAREEIVGTSVNIVTPVGGSPIKGAVSITWNTSGQFVSLVDIHYVLGDDKYPIAYQANNTGRYDWDLPASLAGKRIELYVSLSDARSVVATDAVILDIDAAEDSIPEIGPDGAPIWQIPDLSANLVKSPYGSTVYYLSPTRLLYPFYGEKIFGVWGLSFDTVRELPLEQLSQFALGVPMTPPPGSVLMKSPLDAKVYVLEPNDENPAQPILHWLTGETVAKAYFGADWASKIIDVAPSVIMMAPKGDDLTDAENPPWYIGLY